MDPIKEVIAKEVLDKTVGKAVNVVDEKGKGWFIKNPILAPLMSLTPLVGVFAYVGLRQNYKTFLFLFFGYDMLLMLFPPLWFLFKILVAIDTWTLAKRLQAGRTLREWEWFWSKS
jgi:hypothetical protein